MNNLSNERLNKIRAETFAETARGANASVEVNASLLVAVLDELLALREAGKEPVAYFYPGNESESPQFGFPHELDSEQKANCMKLYAAPQLPAVPSRMEIYTTDRYTMRYAAGWNDCLSAIAAAPKPE